MSLRKKHIPLDENTCGDISFQSTKSGARELTIRPQERAHSEHIKHMYTNTYMSISKPLSLSVYICIYIYIYIHTHTHIHKGAGPCRADPPARAAPRRGGREGPDSPVPPPDNVF